MRKCKKGIAALLTFAMTFSLAMGNMAWAEAEETDILAEGDSKNVHWVLSEDGYLEITGTGDWERIEAEDTEVDILDEPIAPQAPWYEYAFAVKSAKVTLTGATDLSGMFAGCEAMASVDLNGLETKNVTDMSYMFSGCTALTSLDISKFATDKVVNMRWMFYNCGKLTALDVSKFNTANVTDMSNMFHNCLKVLVLNVSKFNTKNVTDMSGMFENCEKVAALDVSKFDTGSVTNMEGMFRGCKEVKALNVRDFDMAKVTNVKDMFWGCEKVTSLDVSKFDTSAVLDMDGMFYGCAQLKTVDVSKFDTTQVEDMSFMFNECRSLTSVDVSHFDTGNVTTMCSMFFGCEKLSEINVANFNTENVTDISYMFKGCKSLKEVNVTNFDTRQVEEISEMFYDCDSLKVLDLGSFDLESLLRHSVTIRIFNMVPEEVTTPYNFKSFYDITLNGSYTDEEGNYYLEMPWSKEAGTKLTLAFDGKSKDVEWRIDKETGHLEIGGTGDYYDNTWIYYKKYIKSAKVTTTEMTEIDNMFLNCTELETVDFSEFDAKNVITGFHCFEGCEKLSTILTPCNLKTYISLPGIDWLDEDGEEHFQLPENLSSSITIQREIEDIEPEPEYVMGDADGDGEIRVKDALAILLYLADKNPENFIEEAADCDGNPGIGVSDALAILMHLADKKKLGE